MNVLNTLLPDGSAVRDFVEVGSMLATGVTIGLLCSSIGGVFMDTLGFVATLVLFFGAGFYFLTRKARTRPVFPSLDRRRLFLCLRGARQRSAFARSCVLKRAPTGSDH